jgi:hypothetical protein
MTEDLDGRSSISELPEQASMLPDVIEVELPGRFRSAEFRSIGSPIDQMQLLRTQPRNFTLQIAASLFNKPLTTVNSTLKRLQVMKEAADPESGNAPNVSGPHSVLT